MLLKFDWDDGEAWIEISVKKGDGYIRGKHIALCHQVSGTIALSGSKRVWDATVGCTVCKLYNRDI